AVLGRPGLPQSWADRGCRSPGPTGAAAVLGRPGLPQSWADWGRTAVMSPPGLPQSWVDRGRTADPGRPPCRRAVLFPGRRLRVSMSHDCP
ncbi:hypothetical protein ABZY16_33815, partial [Streptomyces sp. NPDC006553]|uniref:hypothetical protein n=1 Tax=Streptomyces sp. NPDC006553 TaxID=3157180 RepID=UPI00339E40DA